MITDLIVKLDADLGKSDKAVLLEQLETFSRSGYGDQYLLGIAILEIVSHPTDPANTDRLIGLIEQYPEETQFLYDTLRIALQDTIFPFGTRIWFWALYLLIHDATKLGHEYRQAESDIDETPEWLPPVYRPE